MLNLLILLCWYRFFKHRFRVRSFWSWCKFLQGCRWI